MEVYSRRIRGDFYICGLGWNSASGKSLVGSTLGTKIQTSFEQTTLRFITDLLGIKMVKFWESPWWPERTAGWEGMSILRGYSELVITILRKAHVPSVHVLNR